MIAGAWLRRRRGVVAIAVAVLATVTVLSVLTARSAGRGGALDPQNPSADGAQAVARVLVQHDMRLSVVRRAAELERATVDAGTTVLVTSPGNLGRASADRLQAQTGRAGALVLAAPGSTVIRALRLPVTAAGDVPVGGRTRAACDDPLLSGLQLEVPPSAGYRGGDGSVTPCFTGSGEDAASLVLRVERRATTYVVGAAAMFTNQRVDRADNAAAALRLLGQHDRLVWYVPDIRDVAAGDAGSLVAQLPGGLFPALWLLAASALATMLWRGRRLGPLVVEPLPVVVKAVESTLGRGRLYRRVRDRQHAAAILRDATSRRLTSHLRLPAATPAARLAGAVAEATGAGQQSVYDTLVGRSVDDDRDLTRLAADLAALERKAHNP